MDKARRLPRDLKIPCYGCDNRHEACHGSCEKYAEYRKEHDAKREAAREARRLEGIYETYRIKTIKKIKKRNEKYAEGKR